MNETVPPPVQEQSAAPVQPAPTPPKPAGNKKRKFLIILLVLALPILFLVQFVIGVFQGFFGYSGDTISLPSISQPPAQTSTQTQPSVFPRENDPVVGKMCGGIAAIPCPSGYMCTFDGFNPDAGGKCEKEF